MNCDEQLVEDFLGAAKILISNAIRVKAPFGVAHTQPLGSMLLFIRNPELVDRVNVTLGEWMRDDRAKRLAEDG